MGKRKNSTKKERTELLKRLGYTESDMQRFWNECIPINTKIRMLSKAGMGWTDLCLHQIEQLPTLKEVTLEQLKQKEEEERKQEQARLEKEKQDKYHNDNFDKIMLDKIDKGETLSEQELRDLVINEYEVDTIIGENRRWCRSMTTIIKICDRYFAIVWDEGLTEMQEDSFYSQPYEVEPHEYEKVITVKEWVKKK